MLSRADDERLHARIDAVGRDVRETLAEIGSEIAEAQTHAEQAITYVQRVEQYLMEKPCCPPSSACVSPKSTG